MSEPLRIVESRYERLEQIPWWDQDRISRAQVLVAGAGALGNEILKHLALFGVGRIVVVDSDTIEVSNLSRSVLFRAADRGRAKAVVAAERMRDLNPDLQVLPVTGDLRWDLGVGLIRRMDVVLAGLDSIGSRLALNQMSWRAGVPWIDGAIHELSGIMRVYVPPAGACFECAMSDDDYQHLAARYSCQLLPRAEAVDKPVPTTSTSASMIAAWQVQEAIKVLHGRPLPASQGVGYHGLTYEFFRASYTRRETCLAHDSLGEVVCLPDVSCRTTVTELLATLARQAGHGVEVELDREVVLGWRCPSCGSYTPGVTPLARVSPSDTLCPSCGAAREPHLTHRLDGREAFAGVPLRDLGIPPLHVLSARLPGRGVRSFELTGDAAEEPLAGFLRREDRHGNE
jgi:molybdopterin/thiamine biosynthesis adenylyltransferase